MSKFWQWTLAWMFGAACVGFLSGRNFGPGGDFIGLVVLAPAYAVLVLVLALAGRAISRAFRPKSR